ncbi:MAG: hypothetical protein CVV59_00105 [Tenericutes bacterium HGW-Tenericutes-4]|nr:MAG: hypothetical protein CVV59_00105 [Tenericutes bacterium HGW-Tenericutes-4]
MYTDEQIKNMNPKVHPAIKMASRWDIRLEKNEYNKIAEKYDNWAIEMGKYIDSVYGEGCGTEFRQLFRITEFYLALNAGFQIDTAKIERIIKETPKKDNTVFMDQPMIDKLLPIKETVTLVAFSAQAMRDVIKENKNKVEASNQINANMKQMLPLLAQDDNYAILKPYDVLLEDCKTALAKYNLSESQQKLKYLDSLPKKLNQKVYFNKTKDYTSFIENS